jgi:XRE family transcriptional regulator, regulator of sulfur utilization
MLTLMLINWRMANIDNEIAGHLGKNIELLRKKRGLSQAQLAKLAGVPRSTVTYIESGYGNPSLTNLVKIAGAVQISIEELLSRPRPLIKLIRNHEIPIQKKSNGNVTLSKLLPDPIPGMEIDRLEMKPESRMGGTPHTQNTKEYLLCCKGQVELTLHKETYLLQKGDVLAFPGDNPHSYRNPGSTDNLCISVVAFSPVEY